MGVKLNISP